MRSTVTRSLALLAAAALAAPSFGHEDDGKVRDKQRARPGAGAGDHSAAGRAAAAARARARRGFLWRRPLRAARPREQENHERRAACRHHEPEHNGVRSESQLAKVAT